MYQLIYVSAATRAFKLPELGELLLSARRNNERLGVSGILLHHAGSFIQVLEGDKSIVDNLFQKICGDHRHARVLILEQGEFAARSFPAWSMGFVNGEQAGVTKMPGFLEFFRADIGAILTPGTALRARNLLNAFREGRFRQFVES